jgi:hypothetical protein
MGLVDVKKSGAFLWVYFLSVTPRDRDKSILHINNRVTVPWAIQKTRRGNAGLDEDRQSRVQAGARLLPADREFSAEGYIDDGPQFADLLEKNSKV